MLYKYIRASFSLEIVQIAAILFVHIDYRAKYLSLRIEYSYKVNKSVHKCLVGDFFSCRQIHTIRSITRQLIKLLV